MGCQLTTQPHNCWIMSFDDPVRLDRESLSRLCDGDSGCSVCVKGAPLGTGFVLKRGSGDETLTVTLWCVCV